MPIEPRTRKKVSAPQGAPPLRDSITVDKDGTFIVKLQMPLLQRELLAQIGSFVDVSSEPQVLVYAKEDAGVVMRQQSLWNWMTERKRIKAYVYARRGAGGELEIEGEAPQQNW